GLPRADVPLQQPVHRRRRREVAQDLVDRPSLIARQREGQPGMERLDERPVDLVPDPRPLLLERTLARHQADLHADELVELESVSGAVMIIVCLREVDAAVRTRPVDQTAALEDLWSERLGEPTRLRPLQARGDELAELPREHLRLPGLWVDRDDRGRVLTD